MDSSMSPAVRREALQTEYATLVNSPDRAAKYRRAEEIAEQLAGLDVKVEPLEVPAEFQNAADRTPRERAVTKKASA